MRRFAALAATLGVLGGGCGAEPTVSDPTALAVSIETEACGHTSATTGSGVLVGPGKVVTAAHVVIGASAIRVATSMGMAEGTVVVLDVTNDLALLRVEETSATAVELANTATDAPVSVIGASSGTVPASVTRKLRIVVDDVRRTTRSERSGFELDASILPGDSGAGVFDRQGRLVGIVFAVPAQRDDATFAVDAAEIESLLATAAQGHRCDHTASLVVPETDSG